MRPWLQHPTLSVSSFSTIPACHAAQWPEWRILVSQQETQLHPTRSAGTAHWARLYPAGDMGWLEDLATAFTACQSSKTQTGFREGDALSSQGIKGQGFVHLLTISNSSLRSSWYLPSGPVMHSTEFINSLQHLLFQQLRLFWCIIFISWVQ